MTKNNKKVRKEIYKVCNGCGISANVLTCLKKYGQPPKKLAFVISTYGKGVCDCCRKKKHVTETRDFFYPEFELLGKVAKFLHETAK